MTKTLMTFTALVLFTSAASFAAGNPKVSIKTTEGEIQAELYADKAPITVKNFLGYVKKKQYDGTIFHRVIAGFMIQGGGYDTKMNEKKTGPSIKNEATNGLKNEEGTLSMARRGDPNSASAQFFINATANSSLDHQDDQEHYGYAVFGKVTKGLDVVHKIEHVQTGAQDVPVKQVVIQSIKEIK
jgi:cyclophilin family peptidyl-prolyl cis-trans isomerase